MLQVYIHTVNFFLSQHATVIPWAPCHSTWPTARSATPPMETASANRESAEPTATVAWWDTGASTSMAAVHVTVQETVIRSLETACLGE